MAKSVIDFIDEADIGRYNELMDKAAEAKKNAPKAPRTGRPKTPEEKKKSLLDKMAKAQAQLDALLAAEGQA